jgi:hypothetical protein
VGAWDWRGEGGVLAVRDKEKVGKNGKYMLVSWAAVCTVAFMQSYQAVRVIGQILRGKKWRLGAEEA